MGHILAPYKKVVILFMTILAACGLHGPFHSLLIKKLINELHQWGPEGVSRFMGLMTLIVVNFLILDNVTWRSISYIEFLYQGRIKGSVIHQVTQYLLTQSHSFFQDRFSGQLSGQVSTLANGIEQILHHISIQVIRGSSLLVVSLVTVWGTHPVFSGIIGVYALTFITVSFVRMKKIVALTGQYAETESDISGQLVDTIGNQSNIRLFSREKGELSRISTFIDRMQRAFSDKEKQVLILNCLQGAMISLMMAASGYALIYLYARKSVTVGDFALILGLSIDLAYIMWYTMEQFNEGIQTYGKCKQSLAFLIQPVVVQDIPDAVPLQCDQGRIVFEGVTFSYPGGTPVFSRQSLVIDPGQKVGLVGYSGGGKTTLTHLLLRFYDVDAGRILIDNQDIRSVTQSSLHESIGMIPQDPSLFHRTLKENIRYGRMEATDEEVIDAAKKAHAHEFISSLPQGYDTSVGERGVKLSGGQRQRIAMARAILKDAPILILDEATSQLDSVTEALIQDSLWDLMNGFAFNEDEQRGGLTSDSEALEPPPHKPVTPRPSKTVLVIAHRLSTLMRMDRILVVDKGRIVEDGTHRDLIEKKGLYKKLWDSQVGGFLGDHKPLS